MTPPSLVRAKSEQMILFHTRRPRRLFDSAAIKFSVSSYWSPRLRALQMSGNLDVMPQASRALSGSADTRHLAVVDELYR